MVDYCGVDFVRVEEEVEKRGETKKYEYDEK